MTYLKEKTLLYYIYAHYTADTNEIFYIGKGVGRRAYKRERNNSLWTNIYNKHGLKVKILFYFDNEQLSLITEKYLIKSIGRRDLGLGPLANMTDGGEGTSGRICLPKTRKKISKNRKNMFGKNNPTYDHTIFHWFHENHIEEHCTRHELQTKYKLDQGALANVVKGTRNHHSGWSIAKIRR
jgi:hypothetical protein